MGRRFAAALVALSGLTLPGGGATAMQFEPVRMTTSDVLIVGRGPIVRGDTDRFTRALTAVSQSGRPLGALSLDSGGGNVMEAKQMMVVIRERRITVVLAHNARCASACFLLFAASPRRLAAADALVGVHSASLDGAETDTSLAVTTLMARDAGDLGVPPAIVGKMVETSPGRVAWLGPGDLTSMNVTLFDGDLTSALHQQPAVTNAVMSPAAPDVGIVPPATSKTGAALGRTDRQAWDDWIANLRDGEYRDGAEFARTRFPDTRPGDCYGPDNLNRGDFTLGCTIAQKRLSRAAEKINADQDYASGWNATPEPAAADERVAQEYLGVYFCAAQVARLNVKIYTRPGAEHGRALIAFGPHGSNTSAPRGSFLAEGAIDSATGAITIAPVRWVSQPPNVLWFGINGGSDDGGRTFAGRVTDNPTCTWFTLARRRGGGSNP